MKRWLLIAALSLFAIFLAAIFVNYERKNVELREAYGAATDAYVRAYEYRNAGDELYESRWRDFEIARDQYARLRGPEAVGFEKPRLAECGGLLAQYRADRERIEEMIANAGSIESVKALENPVRQSDELERTLEAQMESCVSRLSK